jgi:hypothetical protein
MKLLVGKKMADLVGRLKAKVKEVVLGGRCEAL